MINKKRILLYKREYPHNSIRSIIFLSIDRILRIHICPTGRPIISSGLCGSERTYIGHLFKTGRNQRMAPIGRLTY